MIRVMYLISTLKRSGPVNVLYDLVSNIDRSRFEPIIVTLSPEPADSLLEEFKALGVNVIALGLSRIEGLIFARARFREYLRVERPVVVHSHGFRADIINATLNKTAFSMSTVHNFPQEDYRSRYQILSALMVLVHRLALRRLNRVVAVSQAAAQNLIENLGIERTVAVPNGVDVSRFKPVDALSKKDLRAVVKLPPSNRVWISVGHLSSVKDPIRIIEDWGTKFGNVPMETLVFVGSGPLFRECKDSAKKYNNIIFVGRTRNVHQYLQSADVFISASKSEGFHIALAEALGCGLPVVISDIPAHREFMSELNDIGYTFSIEEEGSLFNVLNKFDEHYLENKFAIDTDRIGAKFSSKSMATRYEKIYTDETVLQI